MRVLHVISSISPETGGPAEALRGFARAQVRSGLLTRVIALRSRREVADLEGFVGDLDIPVRLIGPPWGPLGWHPRLAPELARSVADADVVHIHGLWEEIQHRAARIARAARKPYLIRPCGMLDPWSLRQSRWKKWLYLAFRLRDDLRGAAALHFTSRTEHLLTKPLRLDTPGIVEPNGVTLDEFDQLPGRSGLRRRLGIPADRPLVLFLGRVHHKKGLTLLLRAFAALSVDSYLVVAGPGEDSYVAGLRAEATGLGIGPRLHFAGMLTGAAKLEAFVDADLFVLPSSQENFGIAVVESLAAGTPVLVSDQVNIHDDITDGGVGASLPLLADAWTRGMALWLTDHAMRRAAADRARDFVRERYSWDRIARRWAGHYDNLVAATR